MTIRITTKKDVTVLVMLDDVILDNVREVQDTIQTLISQGNVCVVMDLSAIEFITSRGLGAIGKAMDTLRKQKGDLKLIGIRPELRKIIDICGLSKIIDIVDSLDEALVSFGENIGTVEKRLLWSIWKNENKGQ